MAIPTGSGSEVLKTGTVHALNNNATEFKIDGSYETAYNNSSNSVVPANTIITILNVVFCNHYDDQDEKVNFYVYNGSNNIWLLNEQPLSRQATFVWAEKIVLQPTWKIWAQLVTDGNVDVTYNYIVQDWT